MKKFYVEYEVRKVNAIGIFWLKGDCVIADSTNKALSKFREKYAAQYEFRFPSQCYEIK